MAGGFRIQLLGVDETIKRLKKEGINIRKEVGGEVGAVATLIEKEAVQRVPVAFNNLKNSISRKFVNQLTYEVVAQSKYAAYVEFGTKKKFDPPPGFESYAAQFKGQTGGTFNDLLLNIALWVKRKGIAGTYNVKTQRRRGGRKRQDREDIELAWPIAFSIAKNGIKAQRFMYPALMNNKDELIERVKALLKNRR